MFFPEQFVLAFAKAVTNGGQNTTLPLEKIRFSPGAAFDREEGGRAANTFITEVGIKSPSP